MLATAASTVLLLAAVASGSKYPECWIREGECLDDNAGPLLEGVKPQINQNVVDVVEDVQDFDACASQCVMNQDCRCVSSPFPVCCVLSFFF